VPLCVGVVTGTVQNGLSAEYSIPGTESPGSCRFFIYFRPAKNTKFCGSHLLCSHALAHVSPRARYIPHQFLRFVITRNHPFSPSPISTPQRQPSKMQGNTLFGLIHSSTVSVAVQPTAVTSTITLAAVHRLGLLPLFDRYGRYACSAPLSIPTTNGFYTCRTSLRCCHAPGESDIVLGSDWIFASGATLCNAGSGLLDPAHSAITSLPEGYHWTPNEGESSVCHSISVR